MKGEISLKNIIGQELLDKIQNSYLKYLESSAAIYEVNGDYASALFSSHWCDFLNQASRELAGDISEEEAMKSGKWICHEDCWATSLKSMKDKKPCEIECSGGIKIFAAPIIAEGMVIGSNNAGVSNPPTDKKKINEIAEKYKVDPEELLKVAKDYHPRPEYVLNAAKNHISSAAYTIADIFLRKQAEEALSYSEQRYRSLLDDVIDSSEVGIFILDSAFKVVWVNRALERYFGLRRDEIIGKDKRQLIRKGIKDIFENAELFSRRVIATYDNNTYIENFECHVLPGGERKERWLKHWSQPIKSGIYAGGRIEHYTDITEGKKVQAALDKSLQAIRERVKELDCLYGLARLVEEPGISLEGIFQGLANLIPPGWQYPDITCGRVIFGNKEFKTDNFKSTRWKQSSDIRVKGKKAGSIEVCYLEEKPEIDEGPFLKEERNLISAIAERLGRIIERKKAEEAIRIAKEEWERTFNALPDLIALMDNQYRIIQINKAMADKLGIAQQKAAGLKCYENIHGTKEPPPFCPHSQTLTDGKEHAAEIHEDRLGGDFLITTSPVHDSEGRLISCVHVARNITEHNRKQAALDKSLQALKERVKELDCLYGLARLVEEPDIALEGIFQGLANLIPPGWQYPDITCAKIIFENKEFKTDNFKSTRWKQSSDIMVTGKKAGSVEVCYLEERPEIDEGPFLKEEGNLITAITERLGRIIERRKAEEELAKSAVYIDAMGDSLIVLNLQRKVVKLNKAAMKLFGYSQKEVPELTFEKIFPEKEHKRHYAGLEDTVKTGRVRSFETMVVTKDGTEIPALLSGTALKDSRGDPIGFVGVCRDITELKKKEKTLEEQKIALEKKNIALKEILYQLEIEKKQVKDNVLANIDKLLLPGLRKLRSRGMAIAGKYIDVLQNNLENLASSFGHKLSSAGLTPRESEICNMIKSGLETKEIAKLLHIGRRSVETHRFNIRKKFSLDNRKINLISFLRNL